jgi:ribosome-binding ATPase YchF (GTP1/OBG family)
VQVVRAFEDENIVHVAGRVDPLDDIDVINLELALADLALIEKRLERLKKGGWVGGGDNGPDENMAAVFARHRTCGCKQPCAFKALRQ